MVLSLGVARVLLEITSNLNNANFNVCPGIDVVYECTTNASFLTWDAFPVVINELVLSSNGPGYGARLDGIVINIESVNPLRSTMAILSSSNITSTAVICNSGSVSQSLYYRKTLGM